MVTLAILFSRMPRRRETVGSQRGEQALVALKMFIRWTWWWWSQTKSEQKCCKWETKHGKSAKVPWHPIFWTLYLLQVQVKVMVLVIVRKYQHGKKRHISKEVMLMLMLKDLDEVYQKDEEIRQQERSRSRMQSEERWPRWGRWGIGWRFFLMVVVMQMISDELDF